MSQSNRDPLLIASRSIVQFLTGVALVVATLSLIGAPVILVGQGYFVDNIAAHTGQKFGWSEIIAATMIFLFVAAMAGMVYQWLKELRRIIDSVSEGDPFVPENAARLSRMGWLTITIQIVTIPTGGIAHWLASRVENATSDFG
ncbi:MAG: hypothetical protein RIQ99_1537, partial [Pseudomonadota bacterium]